MFHHTLAAVTSGDEGGRRLRGTWPTKGSEPRICHSRKGASAASVIPSLALSEPSSGSPDQAYWT